MSQICGLNGLGSLILTEGTEIFLQQDAPGYVPGKFAILVIITAQIFVCFLLRWVNLCLNRKKREVLKAAKASHGWTDEDVERERQKHAFLDLTDRQ